MAAPNQTVHNYDTKSDELVGSLFFKASVAMSLSQADVPYEMLKSDVKRFLQSYNYDSAAQYLRIVGTDRVSRINAEPEKTVFQLLGFIYRSSSASGSYKVMQKLLTFGREDPTVATANSTNRGSENARSISESGEQLQNYTSTLYEEGNRRDVVVRRTFLVLSQEPPRFKATVSFGAVEATSIGRTKKIAGHMAAKAICERLNFPIQIS